MLRRQLHHGLEATDTIAAALVNLVRDIDEDEARSMAHHLADKRSAQPLRLVQEFICRFSVTDHTDYAVRGVPVLQHRQGRPRVTCEPGLIDGWLMFPRQTSKS